MSFLWTRTGNGVAKDPSSFMGGPSSPCRLQVTSSANQTPSRFASFHRHHHPHSRCARHSSQDEDGLKEAQPASSYKHQTISMAGVGHSQFLRGNPPWAEVYMQVQHEQQIHPPPWPETKHSSANNLHGQRFLRRYNNLILTTTKHASSLLKTPHTPPNLLTPNLLSARRTTGSLQWSDSPPWDIVVHPFSFIFF